MHPVFVHAAIRNSLRGQIFYVRSALIEGRVTVLWVVEPNRVNNDPVCLVSVGNFMQVDCLLRQQQPQSFERDVVEVSSLTVHWYINVVLDLRFMSIQREWAANNYLRISIFSEQNIGIFLFDRLNKFRIGEDLLSESLWKSIQPTALSTKIWRIFLWTFERLISIIIFVRAQATL